MAQQRTVQVELEDNQQQVRELTHAKKQLQADLASVKDRLEVESLAKNEETSMARLPLVLALLTIVRCSAPSRDPSSGNHRIVNNINYCAK